MNFTGLDNTSINVQGGGTQAYICVAFDFSEEFLVEIPTVELYLKIWSNQIKYPHFREAISLTFS